MIIHDMLKYVKIMIYITISIHTKNIFRTKLEFISLFFPSVLEKRKSVSWH